MTEEKSRPARPILPWAVLIGLTILALGAYVALVYGPWRESSDVPSSADPQAPEKLDPDPPGVSGRRLAVVAADLNVGWLSDFHFAPDGQSVTYVAEKDGRFCVVRGDLRGDLFEAVGWPVLSPDGSTVAYGAKDGSQVRVVVGGAKSASFDEVREITFSADGRVVAYRARVGTKWRMVIGESEGALYEDVGLPALSSDGRVAAYRATKGESRLVVVGGKEGALYWGVGDAVVHPEGKLVAHIASRPDAKWVVVDGRNGKEYEEVGYPVFVGDNVAYLAVKKGQGYLVRGAEEQALKPPPHCGIVRNLFFSASGVEFAYVSSGSGRSTCSLTMGDRSDGDVDNIRDLVFRSDGKAAYWALSGSRWYVAPDGFDGDHVDWVLGPPAFTAGGGAVRYPALIRKREIWWRELALK